MTPNNERAEIERRVFRKALGEIIGGYPSLNTETRLLSCILLAMESGELERLGEVVEVFLEGATDLNAS